jgi:hypothetical protein
MKKFRAIFLRFKHIHTPGQPTSSRVELRFARGHGRRRSSHLTESLSRRGTGIVQHNHRTYNYTSLAIYHSSQADCVIIPYNCLLTNYQFMKLEHE